MRILLPLLALAASCIAAASDEPAPAFKNAANTISHDLVTCAAYFFIASDALARNANTEAGLQYQEAGHKAFELATAAGDIAGLLAETHTARLEIGLNEMKKRIANDYVNISILFNDHAEQCISLQNNPIGHLVRKLIDAAPQELRSTLAAEYAAEGIDIPD